MFGWMKWLFGMDDKPLPTTKPVTDKRDHLEAEAVQHAEQPRHYGRIDRIQVGGYSGFGRSSSHLRSAPLAARSRRADDHGDITGADFAIGLATGMPMPSPGGILGASIHNASHSSDHSSPSHHSSSHTHDSGSSHSSYSDSSSSSSSSDSGSSSGSSSSE